MIVTVEEYLQVLYSLENVPYLWSGKGIGKGEEHLPLGVDCSGAVTWALWRAGGPDWRATHNTDRLWAELESVANPRPGVLAFYAPLAPKGPGDVEHVMCCTGGWERDGRVRVFGASGGDSTTTTPALARAQNAQVRFRTSHLYRARFCGFRALPLRYP